MILRWLPEDITVHNEDLEGKIYFIFSLLRLLESATIFV
jgi:hypothetical protein